MTETYPGWEEHETRCTWRYKLSTKANDKVKTDKKMKSECGKYTLKLHCKGNLVLYKKEEEEERALWSSNTEGKGEGPWHMRMQEDGNLVVYDTNDEPTWASDTSGNDNGPFRLIVQEDGNAVIYDKDSAPIWATNTMQTE